jgi:hypothetical protein
MPVSLEDAMSLLDGATMHNITKLNLRDGEMVTFVAAIMPSMSTGFTPKLGISG